MVPSLMYVDCVLEEHRREARRQAERFRLVQIARQSEWQSPARRLAATLAQLLRRCRLDGRRGTGLALTSRAAER